MTDSPSEKLTSSRRVIYDEGGYKLQRHNHCGWRTMFTIEPPEVDTLVSLRERVEAGEGA